MIGELGLNSIHTYTKAQWSKAVNRAIDDRNYREILNQIKNYKKLSFDELSQEEYEVKPYLTNLSLSQARSKMRLRAKVFGSAKFNFQSGPK